MRSEFSIPSAGRLLDPELRTRFSLMKRALITGVAGQDGSYLAALLTGKGYEVFGTVRNDANPRHVPGEVRCMFCDLADHQSIRAVVSKARPDEVYNLAGVTDLKSAYENPAATMQVNCVSVGVLLDACIRINPEVRFLQASSSEIFLESPLSLNESSPRDWGTRNPYAAAKLHADRDIISKYRDEKSAFACSAFLFNHESSRRSEKSALRKIARTLARIRRGLATTLVMGNPDVYRDWGYAGEYVEAMWKMLQLDSPHDLVIASGVLSQVRDAVHIAAEVLGISLSWHGAGVEAFASDQLGNRIVTISPHLFMPAEHFPKRGDNSKAARVIGWRPMTDFRSLVRMMATADFLDIQN